MNCAPKASWAQEAGYCIHCRKDDFAETFGPRTFIVCSCCQVRTSIQSSGQNPRRDGFLIFDSGLFHIRTACDPSNVMAASPLRKARCDAGFGDAC